jgi:LPS-assembly protein
MPKLHPLALAAAVALAHAQGTSPAAVPAKPIDEQALALELLADEVRGRPDLDVEAVGRVEFKRGGIRLSTDRLEYDQVLDQARAHGNVKIQLASGDRYSGSELQLTLGLFEGYFLLPEYWFARTGAGGRAQRIDFIDSQRSLVTGADYTSCTRDGAGTPAWLLSTDRIKLDFEANEGIAEGAVLRFMGVPILAAPVMSFPVSDARKSGWLPPSISLDSTSGFTVGVPWYWNIAPQRDATLAPIVYTRRGLGLDAEFRYLEPRHGGDVQLHWLPRDRVFGSGRHGIKWQQSGVALGDSVAPLRWHHEGLRVSDDDYWKDFPRELNSFVPRLLSQSGSVERSVVLAPWLTTTAYARVQTWQVLQDPDPSALIVAPYERAPQLGWRGAGRMGTQGPDLSFEAEVNRFRRPSNDPGDTRAEGDRVHLLVQASQTWRTPGAWLTPRLALNLARYVTDQPMSDGRTTAARAIPTFSLDAGLVFERRTRWFGRDTLQTLEPRLVYVSTPFRAQASLPLFDSAIKDFNYDSVFSDNAFTGIDRVSDAHQVTAGIASRWINPSSGNELLRLGLAQRYLLRDQFVTPDGVPLTQRLSNLLLVGTAHLSARWSVDAAVQYDAQNDQVNRSVIGARYMGGPFRVISANYRLIRGSSEQLDLGWQWPVYRGSGATTGRGCTGTLYGVGRINYSMRDSRITDSLAGLEYDAGCWIGRAVAERVSTGRAAAVTRLMLQLELVGLSRLGSNPLSVLKDNIPGYTLLRDERSDPPVRTYTPQAAPAAMPVSPAQ